MNPRILLIGVHTWRNLGDRALNEAALAQLHQSFPKSKITVAATDLESFEGSDSTVPSIFRWVTEVAGRQAYRFAWFVLCSLWIALVYRLTGKKLSRLAPDPLQITIEAYLQADLIVCNPGGYFFSYGKGSIFLIIAYSMALAILMGKPLYLFPQSFGPFQRAWEKKLARWVLSHARLVMVREPISLDVLVRLGIPAQRCKMLPDTAFTFQGEAAETALAWLAQQEIDINLHRPLLGLTVMDWKIQDVKFTGQEKYEAALEATVRHFVSRYNGHILLLPQTSGPTFYEDDRLATQRLAERLSDVEKHMVVIDEPLSPGLLQAVLGQLDVFIGTRMHSNIFALSHNVPVIAIGYMHKTRGIARMLGIEDWVIEIDQINEHILIDRFDALWQQRLLLRAHMEHTMLQIRDQAQQAGKSIAADYFSMKTFE